ncbi:predicted protein [Nematostella vectensis]|uniref:G-protein coupled receptors family 1 profile domain-containing protein n=1 Tax=Nematostella vectensis TaxID=45351 RepID=A7SNV7_NEMVE|nr:adenosine receptor A3 [Nematostella vectensis]EDO34615.1 predicted protein [Nematostella vectensis]|eukprot:XP_001626715.1 predicted protein [Nematostella vectensis]
MNETSTGLSACPDYYQEYFHRRKFEDPDGESERWVLSFFVVNVVSAFFSAFWNGFIIAAVSGLSSRRNPSHLMLINMALTDFAVGLFAQPLFACLMYAVSMNYLGMFCDVLYPARFLTGTLCPASFLTITVISVDRYLAIRLKIRYRMAVTSRRVFLSLALVWGIGLIGGVSFNTLSYGDLVNVFTVGVLFCLIVISFSYVQAFKTLKLHCANLESKGKSQRVQGIDVKKYKKMLKTMALIVTLLVLFYSPIAVSMLLFKLDGITPKTLSFFYTSSTLALVNSSINPLIYIWKMQDVRQACLNLWRRITCRADRVIAINIEATRFSEATASVITQ